MDSAGASYSVHEYLDTGAISGIDVATVLGQSPEQDYKTLVTLGKSGKLRVFLVQVDRRLDLKKAATATGEKSISMMKDADLFKETGYIHGGCSPLGIKKACTVIIDSSALSQPLIRFSAGVVGFQLETTLFELEKALKFDTADIQLG